MSLALFSLFLAAFSIGTTEFVIAGLLPAISGDLGVSIPTAGLLVSGYAAGVAIGGPILSLATSRFPRKTMVLVLMGIFIFGHLLCALAPSYELLMAARIVVSLSHGCFFGLAAILAYSIVPPERRGGALALVFAGITVANIVGVPGGTAIGNALGWRATFWVVGAIAVLATLAMARLIPRDGTGERGATTIGDQFRALGNQKVLTSYVMIILMMIGFFSTFTFIAPLLLEATRLDAAIVPWVLLLFGAGSTVGIFVGGRLADWRPTQTLLYFYPLQLVVYAAILLLNTNPAIMTLMVFAMGASVFGVGSALQNRILSGAGAAPDLASTLIASAYNFGIAIGSSLGAAALAQGVGYTQLPWIGCTLAAVTTLLALLAIRLDRRVEAPA